MTPNTTTRAPSLTASLSADHRVIHALLDVLVRLTDEARRGQLRAALASRTVDLIRRFGDESHHRKEEEHLFPALQAAGLSRKGGPLAVMLAEHDVGRDHLARMREALAAASTDPSAASRFAQAALGYAAIMKQHIAKEDLVLFPMADDIVPADLWPGLNDGFREAEVAALGPDTAVRDEIDALVVSVLGQPAERRAVARP